MSDDGEWFAPKRFGLGAGAPIAWQGWVIMGCYLVAVLGSAALLAQRHRPVFFAIVAISTLAFSAIAARHTKGGWRWRWGSADDR
jgi:hypothetical protein